MDIDLTFYLLKAGFPSWAETSFYVVSSVVLVATAVAAVWRFRVFRLGQPHVKIELDVTSRRSSPRYKVLSVVAIVTNTSRVVTRCTEMIWRVRVLAPYTDEAVDAKVREYEAYHDVTGPPVEFPWNVNHELTQKDARIYLDPGESNTVIMSLAIPDWITAIDVEAMLRTTSPEVWVARCTHDLN